MKKITYLFMFLFLNDVITLESNSSSECPNKKTHVSLMRKRRHLVFPDGSNFVTTLSLVKAIMTHVPSGWNTVLEIDVLFPLPNANFTNAHFRRKLHHRQKKDVWDRIRGALEFHNINGRACVLKSICDARTHLAPPGHSLVHDLLRAVFTAPLHEEHFVNEVSGSYREMMEPEFCKEDYECPISLLHFLLSLDKEK